MDKDTIYRQAAIDFVDSETVSTNPEYFKSSGKFIEFMDDADIASFGKWQWANGFNTALVATTIQLKKLPSAQPEPSQVARDIATIVENEQDMRVLLSQPEIIRCKDCKYWRPHSQYGYDYDNDEFYDYCALLVPDDDYYAFRRNADDYCSDGERRTDDK